MSWQPTAPAAVDALVAMLQVEATLDGSDLNGVEVLDGPVVEESSSKEVFTVGWTGDEGEDAVTGSDADEGLSGTRLREQYTVHCAAFVLNGAKNMAVARDRAYAIAAGAGAVVLNDSKLRGTVMRAKPGAMSLRQEQNQRGAIATVLLDIDVDAYSGG